MATTFHNNYFIKNCSTRNFSWTKCARLCVVSFISNSVHFFAKSMKSMKNRLTAFLQHQKTRTISLVCVSFDFVFVSSASNGNCNQLLNAEFPIFISKAFNMDESTFAFVCSQQRQRQQQKKWCNFDAKKLHQNAMQWLARTIFIWHCISDDRFSFRTYFCNYRCNFSFSIT